MTLGNIGEMLETKLQAAGVELKTDYRLVLLDVPELEVGDMTIDVTNHTRLFNNYRYRNLNCVIGGLHQQLKQEQVDAKVIRSWLEEGKLQSSRVSVNSFDVDLSKSELQVGSLRPNPSVCLRCTQCNRTYHRDELQLGVQTHKCVCTHCHDEAWKKYKAMSRRERRREKVYAPVKDDFRFDKARNVLRYERPVLDHRSIAELVIAASIPPDKGGVIELPRPFVMFEPGTSKVVWEPDSNDVAGRQLKERCTRIPRRTGIGQQPVPLKMVLETYAEEGRDWRPWIDQAPLKVPGIIGVQLLVEHRMAGWISNDDLRPDISNSGWWREMPEYKIL